MKPIQEAITGKGTSGDSTTPYQALVQFYRAFNSGDMKLMSENWWLASDIAMDNPLGGIKRGWEEIRSVYERIYNGPAKVYVEYFDYTIHEAAEMFYAVGRERGYFRWAEKTSRWPSAPAGFFRRRTVAGTRLIITDQLKMQISWRNIRP